MPCGSIYKIQFPNGKHYIGLTTCSLEQRKRQHKHDAKNGNTKCLYNALRKYDMVDTFELVEIDTADTLEELCEKEIRYIIKYNSYYINENGYNMTYGGDGTTGYIYTDEDKQKMSEGINKHYENNPEARQKMREITKKYYQEHPEAGKEHSEKIKKYYKENPEARQKMSEIKKKYYEENPEVTQKMSEIKKKHFENPEAKPKISDAVKKNLEENPELRKKISEAQKKRFKNPEARQKNSEAQKKFNEEHPENKKKRLDSLGQNKPFDVFKKDGTFIGTFNYQFEAREHLQKEHNISSTILISNVLLGNRRSTAGFVFKYK